MNINRFSIKILTFFFIVFLIPFASFADTKLDKIGTDAVKNGLTEGAVILVLKNGSPVHFNAYGTADKGSVFDLASLTKIYATTLAVMKLVDEGVISVSDKVSDILPQFEDKTVTIEHLLRHTSGLPAWEALYCRQNPKEYLLNIKTERNAGEKRVYSDIGFMILGLIIEKKSGKSLDKFVSEEFYKPMSLTSLGYLPSSSDIMPTFFGSYERNMINNRICQFPKEGEMKGVVNDGNARLVFGGVAGHAGLFGNAIDIASLTEMLASGGVYKGKRYIMPETVAAFFRKDLNGQGMGFAMTENSLHVKGISPQTFGHTGFTGVSVVCVPEKHLTVIVLTNRQMKRLDKNGRYPDLKSFRESIFERASEL